MTLVQLRELALRYMTKQARLPLSKWRGKLNAWVPAHELAHALLASKEQLGKRRLGLCKLSECVCARYSCLVVEAAATMMSCKWNVAAGRPDLRDDELLPQVTSRQDELMSRNMRRRAIRLLKKKNLWPIPMTVEEVEAAFAAKE